MSYRDVLALVGALYLLCTLVTGVFVAVVLVVRARSHDA